MGIGDSIGRAAENAMEDLAGTSTPTESTEVPEPTDPNSDVEVHSSISEGANAMAAEKDKAPGMRPTPAAGPASTHPGEPESDTRTSASESAAGASDVPSDVPGPGGLPQGDPDELRADPGEGDEDPSTGLGRG
jgi:hypothetical protein